LKRKYLYPVLIIIVTIGFYYIENYQGGNWTRSSHEDKENLKDSFFYLPTSTTDAIIAHDHYVLSYSEKHEQAEWVKNQFKRPYFEQDKKVRSSSADWRNYKRSGYDRGHLCPAGDRRYTYEAFEETFLTSNISPQNHEFNGGVWNRLEQKVRYWAKRYNGVYVVTGGVLSKDLKSIGYEAISVPKYFYKVILKKDMDRPEMIAFLVPHQDSGASLKEFVVSTDKIEKITGIDFFPSLEDDIEKQLEASSKINGWKF